MIDSVLSLRARLAVVLVLILFVGPSGRAAQPAVDFPIAGADVAPLTRTCDQPLATTAADCESWATSGPINVALVAPDGTDPSAVVLNATSPRWRPAEGRWLVAEADVVGGTGCRGWQPTSTQVELRLSPVKRRHFKTIALHCSVHSGRRVIIGDAHTDDWTRPCGDHMIDLDQARQALVASLVATHAAARVTYREEYPPGLRYPAGCGQGVTSDGRVAIITLMPQPAQPHLWSGQPT